MMMSGGLRVAADILNGAAPGANTDILGSNYTPREGGSLRIFVSLATGSVFNVMIRKGSTTITVNMNGGVALTASAGYTFVIGCSTANSYNFQVATNGIINVLQVDEVSTGVI